MASNITRAQIRSLVIKVIRKDLGDNVPIREISRLGEDLGISPDRRAGYLPAIMAELEQAALNAGLLDELDLRGACRVGDITDIVLTRVLEHGN